MRERVGRTRWTERWCILSLVGREGGGKRKEGQAFNEKTTCLPAHRLGNNSLKEEVRREERKDEEGTELQQEGRRIERREEEGITK